MQAVVELIGVVVDLLSEVIVVVVGVFVMQAFVGVFGMQLVVEAIGIVDDLLSEVLAVSVGEFGNWAAVEAFGIFAGFEA